MQFMDIFKITACCKAGLKRNIHGEFVVPIKLCCMSVCKCGLFRLGYRRNENNVIPAHLNPCHSQGRVRDKFTYSVCIMQIEVLC